MTNTNKISKVFVPNSRKQYSRNGSHGNTLPEVNCNRYLHGNHLQHLMWPCWFILLFISGVTSAWRFYFFIRSVRAFGTTQSLLFILFSKPLMTTLPSSSFNFFFVNVWRKNIFDIYVTEYGTALTTILPIFVLRIKTYVSCRKHDCVIQIENRVLLSNLKK
jgi:hypothetical protein